MSATASKANGRGPRVPIVTPLPTPEAAPIVSASPLTPHLDAAVLRVQAAAGKLTRNADGQIQNRTYKYVTLDAVTDEVLPLLVAEDLLWKTFPTALDGEPALRYRMTHIPSGEFDEDTMLLLCDRTSQGQGAGDTYARRYSLVAYLNLTVDPDDDGASANLTPVDRYAEAEAAHARAPGEPRVDPGSPQPTARPAQPTERRISANQRTRLLIPRAKKAKLTDGEFANVILAVAGEPTRTWSSPEHAAETLKRLLDHLPARLKDAVLEGIDGAKP